jgi:hypothetical protein
MGPVSIVESSELFTTARRQTAMQEFVKRGPIGAFRELFTKAFAVAGLVLVSLALMSSPAHAHSAANSPASNYRTKLVLVTPASNAYEANVIETGNRFELRWKSGPELIVPDYDDHPYLRIGPKGVEENQQSNAKYLNSSRMGSTNIPDGLKPEGPPQWKRISAEPVARWHDHRIHRMTAELPEPVAKAPNKSHVIDTAPVLFSAGSTLVTATTEMRWIPGPSPVPYFVLAGLLAVVALGAALWARNNLTRRRVAVKIICALCLVLVVADVVHLVGISFGVVSPLGEALGRMVSVGFVSLAAWAITLTGIVLALRNRLDAPYLLTFGAALMAVVGGLADLGVLSKSSLPVAFGDGGPALVRLLVAITIGLGIGVAIAGVLLTTPISARSTPTGRSLSEDDATKLLPSSDSPNKNITEPTTKPASSSSTKAKANNKAKGWDLD